MTKFILGLFIGVLIGTAVMCALNLASNADDAMERYFVEKGDKQ